MEVGKGREEELGTERDFFGGSGHMVNWADDVLLSYILETCMVL